MKKVIYVSECIICRGDKSKLSNLGFSILDVDAFLMKGVVWLKGTMDDIWSFRYNNKDIDTIITDAQHQMQNNVKYEDTLIYEVLNHLVGNKIEFVMWYAEYVDDLDICNSKEEVLNICHEQIMDQSGMCEVYIVSNFYKG